MKLFRRNSNRIGGIKMTRAWISTAALIAAASGTSVASAQTLTGGAVSAVAGGPSVQFDVTLNPGMKSIAGTQNDIEYNSQLMSIISCSINSEVPKELSISSIPNPCNGSTTCKTRAIVKSVDNPTAMLSPVVLYRCTVTVPCGTALGTYPLTITNTLGSDALGQPQSITGVAGQVTVTSTSSGCGGGPGPGCS